MPILAFLLFFFFFAGNSPDEIRKVLNDQQADWNRGDIDSFMRGYDDSAETTFMGKEVTIGHASVLANYHKRYPTKDAMGTLDFSAIEIRMLGTNNAVVTGRFHLKRTTTGGGDASGIFSLVFEKRPTGWKIILDHTS